MSCQTKPLIFQETPSESLSKLKKTPPLLETRLFEKKASSCTPIFSPFYFRIYDSCMILSKVLSKPSSFFFNINRILISNVVKQPFFLRNSYSVANMANIRRIGSRSQPKSPSKASKSSIRITPLNSLVWIVKI